MRILFLSQGFKISDHPGWNDALEKLKNEDMISFFINIPYIGFAEAYGWDGLYHEIVKLCKEAFIDVVYFHYFHMNNDVPSPINCVSELRKINPSLVVITSCGDGFSYDWMRPDYPKRFKDISKIADITFSTQMGKAADKMIKWGANNIVFVPNSMCQVRFHANEVEVENHKFDYDIVFVGSNNNKRIFNPVSKYWFGSRTRNKLLRSLYKKFGNRMALYGNGWNLPCSKGPVAFNQQQEVFKKGRVLVGGNPYSFADYYSSNRLFFEVSSGIPTVELSVPRLRNIFRDNDHCYFADTIEGVIGNCEDLLKSDPKIIYSKAAAAAKYIEKNHTQYHRMKFKLDTVQRYVANGRKLDVIFPFFLPEVNLKNEERFAIRTK
jgi:hypothetical protein